MSSGKWRPFRLSLSMITQRYSCLLSRLCIFYLTQTTASNIYWWAVIEKPIRMTNPNDKWIHQCHLYDTVGIILLYVHVRIYRKHLATRIVLMISITNDLRKKLFSKKWTFCGWKQCILYWEFLIVTLFRIWPTFWKCHKNQWSINHGTRISYVLQLTIRYSLLCCWGKYRCLEISTHHRLIYMKICILQQMRQYIF